MLIHSADLNGISELIEKSVCSLVHHYKQPLSHANSPMIHCYCKIIDYKCNGPIGNLMMHTLESRFKVLSISTQVKFRP